MSDDKVNATVAAIRRLREYARAEMRRRRQPTSPEMKALMEEHLQTMLKKRAEELKKGVSM